LKNRPKSLWGLFQVAPLRRSSLARLRRSLTALCPPFPPPPLRPDGKYLINPRMTKDQRAILLPALRRHKWNKIMKGDTAMDTRSGRHRYCPSCKEIVETRVLLEGYSRLRFTAFRPRNVRSYAEQTFKVQTDAEQNGSPWKYWRTRYWGKMGRGFEILNEGIFKGV